MVVNCRAPLPSAEATQMSMLPRRFEANASFVPSGLNRGEAWKSWPETSVLPASRTNDWASIVAALAVALVLAVVWSLLFSHGRAPMFGSILLLAVFWVLKWSIYLVIGLVLIQALMSWVNPHAPMADVFNAISRPLLRPFRRCIPDIGGVDLSPLAFVLLLQMGMMVLDRLHWAVLAG